ncbi:hypothetical protein [Chitinophaga alhagiae]|uniref:hypothetical protein n=1 Tax=Chitinophaga alhagiae TaxID=2203219 RepID=UPI0013004D48|nr:hypothetical protein [Chitinophaga alhagiae]
MRHFKLLCLLAAIVTCMPASAQDSTAAILPDNDIVLDLFGRSREDLFCNYLKVSRGERPLFLEALSQYETEKDPYIQERIALLKVYNEKYTSLDEPMMNSLTKNIIRNDKEFVALQTRFYRRMIKLLGGNRAAMFFQLDNYLELSTRLYIQDALPFIRELESDRKMAVARLKTNIH